MKVLQISTHMNIGGIGNYILFLSRELKARGAEVLIASSGGGLVEELEKSGIPHMELDINTKFELHPKVFRAGLRLAKIIKDEKIEIVHAHSRVSQAVSLFASRIAGIPYVTTCHGYFKKRLRGIFDTWGVKTIAISDAVRGHLTKDLGVDENRIALIYNGVDISRFVKISSGEEIRDIKKSLGLKDGPVVGTIGRLSVVKGQRFLIEAMRDVVLKRRDAQALIVGDGPEEEALKDLAASLKMEDSVRFLRSDIDTHKFLSVMDVFVFPSVKEGLGLALLEALASSRPCVASKVGGIEDVIKDGFNGMLVPVGDARAISDSVIRLLDDAPLRRAMGERGRALVGEKFSLSEMAGRVFELYEMILRKSMRGQGARVKET